MKFINYLFFDHIQMTGRYIPLPTCVFEICCGLATTWTYLNWADLGRGPFREVAFGPTAISCRKR